MKRFFCSVCLIGLIGSGCGAFSPKVPQSVFRLKLDGRGELTFTSPKDYTATNIIVVVATNGTAEIRIGGIQSTLNPTNIMATGDATAQAIRESGVATQNALNAAANLATQAAVTAAKAAAKP